ncbi:MAG: hypothetical protein AAGL29_07930 [Bacteroidota bacterium]
MNSIRILACAAILGLTPVLATSQKKIKPIKNPVAWTYSVQPKSPLDTSLQTYRIDVKTDLDPMDWGDEVGLSKALGDMSYREKKLVIQEAKEDTLRVWSDRYIALKKKPYARTQNRPDFTITLTTETYKVENVQLDVDFSDMESAICNVNARARLTVVTQQGDIVLDENIPYYVDEEEKSTLLPIRIFMLNPVFKLKYNLKKKPEKKKAQLQRKLEKYEAVVLRYFYEKSGNLLKEHFLGQKIAVYAATFGIKNKGHEALNETSEILKKNINALSALSKKKRKSLAEIQPDIMDAIDYCKDKLARTESPEISKYLHANLSLGYLLANQLDQAKAHLKTIPEYETIHETTLFQGGFDYYLSGLDTAINTKEKYKALATIN